MLPILGQGFARWFGQLGVFSKKHIHKVVEIFILLFSPRFPKYIYFKKIKYFPKNVSYEKSTANVNKNWKKYISESIGKSSFPRI